MCDVLTQYYGDEAAAKVEEIADEVVKALPGLRVVEDIDHIGQIIELMEAPRIYLNSRQTKNEIKSVIAPKYDSYFFQPYSNELNVKIPINFLYLAIKKRIPRTTIMEVEYPKPETFQVVRDDTYYKVSPAAAAIIDGPVVLRGDLETCRSWIKTFARPSVGLKRLTRWNLMLAIELAIELFTGEESHIERRAITVAALEEGYKTDKQGNKFNMHFDVKNPWSGINREKTVTLKGYLSSRR